MNGSWPGERGPLPNLTVQQLAYLVAAAQAPSWAQAAAELGVTPSALSQGVAELERRVGVPLFVRSGRRRLPDPAAAEVFAYAARVVAQSRDLARWLGARCGGRAGRLRVGMIDAAAVHHYPAALRRFRAERTDLDLLLTVAPSAALLAQLSRGDLDVAVCVAPPDTPPDDVQLVPLRREPLAVYAPDEAPAGGPAAWGPWVTYPADSHTRVVIERALRRLGASVDVVAESHQPDVLAEMVRLGLGWTVLPAVQAEAAGRPLRRARQRPLAWRRLVAARRRDRPPDPAADALVDALHAEPERNGRGSVSSPARPAAARSR